MRRQINLGDGKQMKTVTIKWVNDVDEIVIMVYKMPEDILVNLVRDLQDYETE